MRPRGTASNLSEPYKDYCGLIVPSRIATVRSAYAAASGLCVIIRMVCRVVLIQVAQQIQHGV